MMKFSQQYEEKRQYYESLKPLNTPDSWFAGDLMHYIFVEDFAVGKKVLDAGCGPGYGSYHLSVKGADEVIGVDVSKRDIEKAKARFVNTNLQFLLMDVTKMSFPDKTFDIVVNFEVLEHLPPSSTNLFMKEIVRVLKDDGKFIISTPNRDVYSLGSKTSITWDHINELSANEFIELIGQYFSKCEFFYQLKYDKHELDLRKEQQARNQLVNKELSWRSIIPKPIKKAIKRLLGLERHNSDDSDLIEQMQIWSVEHAERISDLDLSVIQMAVCQHFAC